jgi:peptide/nickel transport system substrate-binding protein
MKRAPVVPLVRETPLQMVGSNVGGAFAHAAMTGYIDYTSLGLKDPQE